MIYYIYHSGVVVELDTVIMVFDFYKIPSTKKQLEEEFIHRFIKRTDKKVYVFCTHSHADHFNPQILNWEKINPAIRYILSDDIELSQSAQVDSNQTQSSVTFTHESDVFKLDDLTVHTFSSTDLGSSFYVDADGYHIFHAGDLHYWNWPGESDAYNAQMRRDYVAQLEKIQKLERIDIAFTPVDPRLEKNVFDGVDLLHEMLKPKVIVPIHYWYDYSAMDEFVKRFEHTESKPVEIRDTMCVVYEMGEECKQ